MASGRPSSRTKGTASKGGSPANTPERRATDQASSRPRTWFLGLSGLIDGGMTAQRSTSVKGGRYSSQETTVRSVSSR